LAMLELRRALYRRCVEWR